jgi:uncharacterized membrane protein YkoI
MRSVRTILAAATLALATFLAAPAAAAECLSAQEQRDAVRSGRVVRPGAVGQRLGEVLQVRLCRSGNGLVWQLTVLGRDGRVVEHVVDAGSGRPRN